MKMTGTMTIVAMAGLMAFGCAQKQVEKQVDKEVSAEPARPGRRELSAKATDAIESSKTLNESQKERLHQLQARIAAENTKLREETSKLKGVLFETVTTLPYQPSKVDVIKKRLAKLNQDQLNLMFGALHEAEEIIGYTENTDRREMLQTIFEDSQHRY